MSLPNDGTFFVVFEWKNQRERERQRGLSWPSEEVVFGLSRGGPALVDAVCVVQQGPCKPSAPGWRLACTSVGCVHAPCARVAAHD